MAHTVNNLKKWSCQTKQLPQVSQVKAIHIYDFDNTLFMTPLPNQQLWTGPTTGYLASQDFFANGGWWHDHHILEATGDGIEKEEPRAWAGWWNELIVNLVQLSSKQKDCLTVLLTGRGEHNFADLIKRMVKSKGLEFDMICLKTKVGPNGVRFSSTMQYKQSLLEEMLYTYKDAEEIKVYEDRINHVRAFRDFFEKMSRAIEGHNTPVARKPLTAAVIHVAEISTHLDPVIETAEVQRMVNVHNLYLEKNHPEKPRLQIKRTVFFTGYLLSAPDTANLLTLVPQSVQDPDLKYLANNIMITPRPASKSILDKVGGMGAKQIWQVNGLGIFQNNVWAARVIPIPQSATYFTENPTPIIVLACRKNAKPMSASQITSWQTVPSDKQFVFETTVGEKVQLRVEREIPGEDEFESLFVSQVKTGKRNNHDDENRRQGTYRGGNAHRGGGRSGRGGGDNRSRPYPPRDRNAGRGGGSGGGGGGGRNRQRGGYKSLDDVGHGNRNGYKDHQPNYDDGPGTDGYNSGFPALGDRGNSGGNRGGPTMYDDGEGLPYGR